MTKYLLLLGLSCGWTLATVFGPATGSPTGGDRNVLIPTGETTADPIRKPLQDFTPFIIGGQEAPENRFPYACSLRMRGTRSHICGGTLIAPNWVLTAAHCFFGDSALGPTPLVYVGAHGIDDVEFAEVTLAEEVIIHESFTGDVEDGADIALIRLSKPSQNKQPVKLAKVGQPVRGGQILATAGWGRTNGQSLPTILQFADRIENISYENCMKKVTNLKDSMICAFSNDQSACNGDSGGPLVIPDSRGGDTITDGNPDFDLLIGIVSFGPRDCDRTTPEVFTSVTSYRGWIEQNMKSSPPGTSKTPAVADQKTNSPPPPPFIDFLTTFDQSNFPTGTIQPLDTDKDEMPGALLSAAENGDLGAVKALINSGADVEAKDVSLETPLAKAAKGGHLDVVEALIEAGAETKADISTFWRAAPLLFAAEKGHLDVVNALLEAGANLDVLWFGFTPLSAAAREGHLDVVKALFEAGANVDEESAFGRTPMMEAAREGRVDVVKFFLKAGVDVNARSIKSAETALHFAAGYGKPRVIQALLEGGALVNARDLSGETPLMEAALRGQGEALQFLRYAGADPNISTVSGQKAKDMICSCRTSSGGFSPAFGIICGEGSCGAGEKERLKRILDA